MNYATKKSRWVIRLGIAASGLALTLVALADHPTLGLQQDGAASITTLTALTLPKGVKTFGIETQFISNNVIGDIDLAHFAEEGEQVHSVEGLRNLSFNAAYGLTDKLTLGFNLPYVTRSGIREGTHHHEEEGETAEHDEDEDSHAAEEAPEISMLGDSSGLGDLTLYSQYRFVGNSDSRTHVSLLLGLKTPTGRTDVVSDEGGRFETEHQPGSGSWDTLAGFSLTRQWSGVSLDSNVLYAFAGKGAQDSNMGDVFNYNVALSHRMEHEHGSAHHHHSTVESSWDVAVELNGEWRDFVTVAGVRQAHTGGNLLYLAPSVRFNSSNGWSAYASLGVPVVENLNGVQSDPKYRLFIGISAGLGGGK